MSRDNINDDSMPRSCFSFILTIQKTHFPCIRGNSLDRTRLTKYPAYHGWWIGFVVVLISIIMTCQTCINFIQLIGKIEFHHSILVYYLIGCILYLLCYRSVCLFLLSCLDRCWHIRVITRDVLID